MTFTSTLNSSLSGLRAAQAGLAVASQNIANANTPGYVRAEVNLANQSVAGRGGGVVVDSITRAADRHLAATFYAANGSVASAQARASLLDRLQGLFGDPNSSSSTFALVDAAYNALAESGADPSSPVGRRAAVTALEAAFADFARVGQGLESLRLEADQRLSESVGRLDELLASIHTLNVDVSVARGTGGDSTGAENIRGAMIDELSQLIDIRVTEKPDGKVEIRTQSGFALIGVDRVQVAYEPSSGAFSAPGRIMARAISGESYELEPHIRSGALAGLKQARDQEIPGIADALGALADTLADELNRLHAVQASAPPPQTVVGRTTGLLGADAHHFTGQAVIGVLTDSGDLTARLTLDFDAGVVRLRDTPAPPDTVFPMGGSIDDIVGAINTALSGAGVTAQFTDGVMRLDAPAGSGIVFGEVADQESSRAGRGFAHFFGLNELARRAMTNDYETGLRDSDAHGLSPGGTITMRATDENGRVLAERSVGVTGATWGDMRAALNAPSTGLAPFGGFALDAAGRMTLVSAPGFKVSVVSDTTERGAGGPAMADVFGLSPGAMARRSLDIEINPEIAGDPRRLGVGRPDLTRDVGQRVLEAGDGRGASALSNVRNTMSTFPQVGEIGAHTATLSTFTARLGAEAGRLAVLAERSAEGASAIAKVATERRASVEGVSIDDEVIRMNAYQQAYAAAARVIQATNEMWQTLLAIR